MTSTDWTALAALIIAVAALALEVRRWFESKARLNLRVMADAKTIPRNIADQPKLLLTVNNVGPVPVRIEMMSLYSFRSFFHRMINRPQNCFIVPDPLIGTLPQKITTGDAWQGIVHHEDETEDLRAKSKLFVGVDTSVRVRPFLIKVPKRKASA